MAGLGELLVFWGDLPPPKKTPGIKIVITHNKLLTDHLGLMLYKPKL